MDDVKAAESTDLNREEKEVFEEGLEMPRESFLTLHHRDLRDFAFRIGVDEFDEDKPLDAEKSGEGFVGSQSDTYREGTAEVAADVLTGGFKGDHFVVEDTINDRDGVVVDALSLGDAVAGEHRANAVHSGRDRYQVPCVAYLFPFYAFEKAHRLDPSSSRRDVRLFKIALVQWLERVRPPGHHAGIKQAAVMQSCFERNTYKKEHIVMIRAEWVDAATLYTKAYVPNM